MPGGRYLDADEVRRNPNEAGKKSEYCSVLSIQNIQQKLLVFKKGSKGEKAGQIEWPN